MAALKVACPWRDRTHTHLLNMTILWLLDLYYTQCGESACSLLRSTDTTSDKSRRHNNRGETVRAWGSAVGEIHLGGSQFINRLGDKNSGVDRCHIEFGRCLKHSKCSWRGRNYIRPKRIIMFLDTTSYNAYLRHTPRVSRCSDARRDGHRRR